jgi:hypothetical protein
MTTAQQTIGSISGFIVKTITVIPGKGEEDVGKVRVVLEASKEDLRAADRDLTAILGAMTMHQSTNESVAVQARFA